MIFFIPPSPPHPPTFLDMIVILRFEKRLVKTAIHAWIARNGIYERFRRSLVKERPFGYFLQNRFSYLQVAISKHWCIFLRSTLYDRFIPLRPLQTLKKLDLPSFEGTICHSVEQTSCSCSSFLCSWGFSGCHCHPVLRYYFGIR